MNRREFFAIAGGITVACVFDPVWAFQDPSQLRLPYPSDFNAYLRINPDGRTTCFVGRIEMGQGNMTSLAQLVAEELSVPVATIDMVMGDTDRSPWDLGTFGSMSIAVFGPVLRRAAAEARAILLNVASEQLHVPVDRLDARDGVVRDRDHPDRVISYGRLAGGVAIERHLPAPPVLKKSDFTVIGTPVPRLDGLEKVTGKALYAGDIRLPGMLYACLLRPPAIGAALSRVDTSAAERVPGAQVVRDRDIIAVLHAQPDEAARACGLIVAEFAPPAAGVNDVTIFDHLVEAAPAGVTVAAKGQADGPAAAAQLIERRYLNSYVAHAPIETHTALASFDDGRMTVWVSTQAPFLVKPQVAAALGLAPDRVRIITPFVGGGFGGKTMAPQAVEAARLARIAGKPVQVAWSRTDEFFFDTFRPAAVVHVRSTLGEAGTIASWAADVYGAGDGGSVPFYDIPNLRVVSHGGWQSSPAGLHPFGVGAWRAPAVSTNTFAREMQMDIMAERAGVDPVTFRRHHLSDARMRRVLEAAVGRLDRPPARAPSGRGIGVACGIYSNTYVATVAEVSVTRSTGAIRVARLICAQDMGLVINPDGARAQMEGALTMGLGYSLTEEIQFADGAIKNGNFATYPIPRFSWLPRLDTILIDAPDLPASAGGEPPIIGVGASIANALYDAVGVRVFQLPLSPARVREALAAKGVARVPAESAR